MLLMKAALMNQMDEIWLNILTVTQAILKPTQIHKDTDTETDT